MGAIRHRYVTAALFITGAIAVCAGQYWIVHAMRSIAAKALNTREIMSILVVVGGFLLSLTLLAALVSIALMTARTIGDRVLTRLRTLLYGWDRFPDMLFSNIEATPLPCGHEKICSDELAVAELHTARSYEMEKKAWPKHCQIYKDCTALSDIVEWVKARPARKGSQCQACLSLATEAENRKKYAPAISAAPPFLTDIGSAPRGGKYTM